MVVDLPIQRLAGHRPTALSNQTLVEFNVSLGQRKYPLDVSGRDLGSWFVVVTVVVVVVVVVGVGVVVVVVVVA